MKKSLIATTALASLSAFSAGKTENPNIIYILADDWGYGDVSCLNPESKIKTPFVDKIAGEGMIFTNTHSTSAVCTPSRYSILTGRYNWRSRLKKHVLFGYSNALIEDGRETAASLLKKNGYDTACIGKWHLGWDWALKEGMEDQKPGPKTVDFSKPVKRGPISNGFDYCFSHCGSLDMPPYVYIENNQPTSVPTKETVNKGKYSWWRKGPTGDDFVHEDVLPNFTRKVVKYIEKKSKTDKPFFVYMPIPAPHTPILPTEQFQGKSGINPYADFVMQVDHHIGEIDKALKANGIDENTLLIITSDNGCSPAAKIGELQKAGHEPGYKFRGHKADIYEAGHRIPYIVKWPKVIKAGSKYDGLACQVDFAATCADIVGAKLNDTAAVDSLSQLPAFKGKTMNYKDREAVIHHSISGSFAIQKGDWKLILGTGSCGWSQPKGEKAMQQGLGPIQLFNLKNDIGETKNVYKQNPEKVSELTKLLKSYVEDGRSTPGAKQKNNGETKFMPKNVKLSDLIKS